MPQLCPKCRRANPPDAVYCYQDGFALGGRNGQAGPVDPGAQPFPHPFVFPNGAVCRNFDQLALACHNEWSAAVELLRQGDLANFLAGLGRADLARAAREAARQADKDRALDQLLGQLPANTIEPAKLHVAMLHVNLGEMTVGKDHRWELRLVNQGMRMLSGTIAVDDCTWLALGEGGGSPRKVFQFQSATAIPVQVRGKLLRAAAKPIQGRLVIETNGGAAVVVVTADVPVKPFPDGVLAGATTPRQIAERAKAKPKEAAALFETGAVARWYIQNGWTYPVQGPAASGIGAVQQFFEALGLTHPPKVEVRESSLAFEGRPGAGVHHTLDVSTVEKRPIFASAVSDSPWLKVSRVELDGRTAHVKLAIEPVPDRPGETLHANLTVRANGNQRFVVPVALRVSGKPRTTGARRGGDGVFPALEVVEVPAAAPTVSMASAAAPPPVRRAPETFRRTSPLRAPETVQWNAGRPGAMEAIPLDDDDYGAPPARTARGPVAAVMAILPVALILVGLLSTAGRDVVFWAFFKPAAVTDDFGGDEGPGGPRAIDVRFHDHGIDVMVGTVGMKPAGNQQQDGQPGVWEPSMRFGVVTTPDADRQGDGRTKKLTFAPDGTTNNAVVRLDDEKPLIFGETGTRLVNSGEHVLGSRGRWTEMEADLGADKNGNARHGKRSVWSYDAEKVDVTQTVEMVAGPQSNRLDTCLVRYHVENHDNRSHRVGLRFLLDTFIGDNDGVPFLIPGQNQLCNTHLEMRGRDIPPYIQACEIDNLEKPGTIARIQFKVGGSLEPPNRVTLGAWPSVELGHRKNDPACRQQATLWDVPVYDIKELDDSAVTMYWDPQTLKPGEHRDVGFAYGLGDVTASEGGKLGLSVGGDFTPGGEFTVTAYVNNPGLDQTVTLTLPEGFKLADGGDLKRTVPPLEADSPSRKSAVTWRVKAGSLGDYTIRVDSSNGASQSKKIKIKPLTLFGGN